MFVRLLKEPLLHFLAAGMLLFLLFDLHPVKVTDSARSIQVGSAQLLPFVSNRNPRLDSKAAAEYLALLDKEQYRQLVEDYIREEVLYREAVALGLDRNNYNARRRLISQLEYINQGFIRESLVIPEDELQTYYAAHRDRYLVVPKITFTHVYFASDKSGDKKARLLAQQELDYLNASILAFPLAGTRGGHFLLNLNYVTKDQQEGASHFGDRFAREVFAMKADANTWQGPVQSAYGYHLVLITSLRQGYYPPLDEVRVRVKADVTRVRVREELERFYR